MTLTPRALRWAQYCAAWNAVYNLVDELHRPRIRALLNATQTRTMRRHYF